MTVVQQPSPIQTLLADWDLIQLGSVQSTDPGYDSRMWDEFRGYVWPELLDHTDMCRMLEELGRARCPLPVQAGFVQVDAALESLEEAGAHHRRRLVSGSGRYAIGMHDAAGRPAPEHVSLGAGQDADGRWYLSGDVRHVTYGDSVHSLLVPARVGSRQLLAVLAADARGVTRVCRPTIAGDRLTDFHLSYAPVEEGAVLAGESEQDRRAEAAVARAHAVGVMAQGAESVGLSAALLAMTVDRVKTREAFGAPLAALQSVQVRTADMYLDLTAARDAVMELAGMLPNATSESLAPVVAATKITVTECALRIAAAAHQLCGGWGLLDEAQLHHFTRAIKAAEGQLGAPPLHRRTIGRLLAAANG